MHLNKKSYGEKRGMLWAMTYCVGFVLGNN